MRNRVIGSLALSILWTSACGIQSADIAINQPRPPRPARLPDAVEVFASGAPARPHVDSMIFLATRGTADQLIAYLRERAAELGCDGVEVAIDVHFMTVVGVCVEWTDAAPPTT